MKYWTSQCGTNAGKLRLSRICRSVPFSEVKNIKMFPLFGGQPSEHIVIKYLFPEAPTSVIHSLSQEILSFSMYILGCEVASLEQDLSIGPIFRRKNYLYVPLILSTGQNGM